MSKLQRGSPSLTDLSVRKVASVIERVSSLVGLPEELVCRIFEEVLTRGKLTPRVLELFKQTEHDLVLDQAWQSAWPDIEQTLALKWQQGKNYSLRQRLQCSAFSVTVADVPVKAPLEELLLDQQPQPPVTTFCNQANERKKRQCTLQSKLQELAEGDPLEEGPLLDAATFGYLARQCNLKPQWHEKVTLLWRLGMTEPDLRKLSSGDARFFDSSPKTVRAKLKFLRSEVGLTAAELCRLLPKQPSVIRYSISGIAAHLDFWRSTGISNCQVAKLLLKQPSLFSSLSVEDTLRPRMGSLRQTGLTNEQVARIIAKCAQVLCTDPSNVSKCLDFLRKIGLSEDDALSVVVRCPVVMTLDVDRNLWPTYNYLIQHLEGTAATIMTFPVYLALSLKARIIPRHHFWILHKQQRLPLSYLKSSDKVFCATHVKQPLKNYEIFKAALEIPDLTMYEGGLYSMAENVLRKTPCASRDAS